MSDILYSAAIGYKKLENTVYRIVIGRKGHSYTIMLHFPPESFFHLAGLQHLTDLTFPSTNKERIYKEILEKNLTVNDIEKSIFYNKWFVEERLNSFGYLKDMIEGDTITYLINAKRYIAYTSIKADYLCEHKVSPDILYLFLVMEKYHPIFKNECKGCSFFRKHDYDYTVGTSKTTTLLIEKEEKGENKVAIFRNPAYVEEDNKDAAN